jgi:hypothetical protein
MELFGRRRSSYIIGLTWNNLRSGHRYIKIQQDPSLPNLFHQGPIREYYRGKYHCTIDLLFDWFGISGMTTDNFCFYLQNRLTQTSQTGGQRYSDTSPFSIPWSNDAITSLSTKELLTYLSVPFPFASSGTLQWWAVASGIGN